ncbi:LOW QUALITY PROTEIN: hypothetical protein U9M48_005777 [Paspalum notatum var. saurae]|uniref:Uncharacterized protein n=1 Tax=Paspalum notatum var. saurae TaxID=547442 RepID=A0AAQ3PMK4_PASNO
MDDDYLFIIVRLQQALLHVDVSPGGGHEREKVDGADGCQQPVEAVEAALVEVVGEPAGGRVDGADDGGAEEEAERERGEEEAGAHGLHGPGALAQEEVELADVDEGLAGADEEELRHQQEDGGGSGGAAGALRLGERGGDHGEHGEEEADEDALVRGEAVRVGGEAAGEGQEEAVTGTVRRMEATKKTVREPAGMRKEPAEPRRRSMACAWETEKVVIWAYTVQKGMVVAQVGSSRTNCFTSSTSVTVHAHPAPPGQGTCMPNIALHCMHDIYIYMYEIVFYMRIFWFVVVLPPLSPSYSMVVGSSSDGIGSALFLHAAAVTAAICASGLLAPSCRLQVQLLEAVPRRAGQEEREAEKEDGGEACAVSPWAAQVVLHVHQHRHGQQRADADEEEEEPVEEARHAPPLPGVGVVELVGAEARDAGLEAARAQRREVETQVQDAQLMMRPAVELGGQDGRARCLERCGDCDGAVSAQAGVWDEASEEAEHEGSAQPRKLVTALAAAALPRCMVSVRLTAMLSVVSRSFSSTTRIMAAAGQPPEHTRTAGRPFQSHATRPSSAACWE